ncbi:MAG: glutaredoxin family protein [bacterium]
MKRTPGCPRRSLHLLLALLGALVISSLPLLAPFLPPDAALADEKPKDSQEVQASVSKTNLVTVYITSWCPACKMTTDYLKEKNIAYTVKDVEKNSDYLKEMVEKVGGYRGVPVVDVNGKIILGFNPYVMDELVK